MPSAASILDSRFRGNDGWSEAQVIPAIRVASPDSVSVSVSVSDSDSDSESDSVSVSDSGARRLI